MVDLCQIACEKHAAAEKNRFERNNQAAATMIKVNIIEKGRSSISSQNSEEKDIFSTFS